MLRSTAGSLHCPDILLDRLPGENAVGLVGVGRNLTHNRTARRKNLANELCATGFPRDKGAGLTVLLNALPTDGRIVLVEPKAELPRIGDLPAGPGARPALSQAARARK